MATLEERLLVRAYYLSENGKSNDLENYYKAEEEEITQFLTEQVNGASDRLESVAKRLIRKIDSIKLNKRFSCTYQIITLGSLASRTCSRYSDIDIDLVIQDNKNLFRDDLTYVTKIFADYFHSQNFQLLTKLDEITKSFAIKFENVEVDIFIKQLSHDKTTVIEPTQMVDETNQAFNSYRLDSLKEVMPPVERATILALKIWKNGLNIEEFKSCQLFRAIRAIISPIPYSNVDSLEASQIFRKKYPLIWDPSTLQSINHQSVTEYARAVIIFIKTAFLTEPDVILKGNNRVVRIPELDYEWKQWKHELEELDKFDLLINHLDNFLLNPKSNIFTAVKTL